MTKYWCCQQAQRQYCRTGPTRNVIQRTQHRALNIIIFNICDTDALYWRILVHTIADKAPEEDIKALPSLEAAALYI